MSALIKRPRLFYTDRFTTQATHRHALFPYFDDGDVIIQLHDEESIWTLRLHRSVLEADSLPLILLLSEEGNYQGGPEGHAFRLTLASPRAEEPIPALRIRRRESSKTSYDICIAYRSFFANLYNRPLLICSSNILRAQYQAEILVYISERYGTLHRLRPYLVEHFTRFHVELFRNIAINPPRWLNLAMALQYEMMYKEALVHLIGTYPNHVVWRYAKENISPELLQVIRTKGRELQHKIALCINELFTITLLARPKQRDANGTPQPMTLNPQSVERWAVVHQHRDWLAAKLREIKHYETRRAPPRPSNSRGALPPRPLEPLPPAGFGILFRTITGDANGYLPWNRVQRDLFKAFDYVAHERFADLEHDLRSLKSQAKQVITRMGLAKKNLVVDEQAVRTLTYLVCAEVDDKDYVWKKMKEQMEE
ncbi:hypothetical protein IWX49DRAFT_109707 [Phyllosticta citricarpa]|uniref:Uncharacterized protein n=2 Tax=Phyllosticta TaxID=121621 RepID=A0ABR1MFG9_9PEZI